MHTDASGPCSDPGKYHSDQMSGEGPQHAHGGGSFFWPVVGAGEWHRGRVASMRRRVSGRQFNFERQQAIEQRSLSVKPASDDLVGCLFGITALQQPKPPERAEDLS